MSLTIVISNTLLLHGTMDKEAYIRYRPNMKYGAVMGLSPPEAREPETRGRGRGGWLGRQEMEEDSNKRERSNLEDGAVIALLEPWRS